MKLISRVRSQEIMAAIVTFLAMLALSSPSMAQVLRAQVQIRGMD